MESQPRKRISRGHRRRILIDAGGSHQLAVQGHSPPLPESCHARLLFSHDFAPPRTVIGTSARHDHACVREVAFDALSVETFERNYSSEGQVPGLFVKIEGM